MTSVNSNDQAEQLLAQHLSQLQYLVQDVQNKQVEASYIGFVADREEQRNDILEGEMSIWQSKLNMGQIAETSIALSKIQAAHTIQHNLDIKIIKLNDEKNSLQNLLDYLKTQIDGITEKTANTIDNFVEKANNTFLDLIIIVFEMLNDVVEDIFHAEENQSRLLKESSNFQSADVATLIEGAKEQIESKRELEQLMLGQNIQKETTISKQNNVYNQEKKGLKQQEQYEIKDLYTEKISLIKEKLEGNNIDIPMDKLIALKNAGNDNKVIIDKVLSEVIYNDLAELIGQDKIVVDQRQSARRNTIDRRENTDLTLSDDIRADAAGRRKGDRRSDNSSVIKLSSHA